MINNKKGVSVIIGYVLLISFGIILSIIVYNYLKTYVPSDSVECPEGVSILIKDYTCSTGTLTIDLRNNGRFNIAGYYIYYSSDPNQEIAVDNLANNFTPSGTSGVIKDTYILLDLSQENSFGAGGEITHSFSYTTPISFIEIIPVRFEEIGKRKSFAACSQASLKQIVNCS